jgi:hypothetical protein
VGRVHPLTPGSGDALAYWHAKMRHDVEALSPPL